MSRTFTPAPMPQKETVYPTTYKLAVHARQSRGTQVSNNEESHELQTEGLYERALALGWQPEDIILFVENEEKENGRWSDASGTKRIDQRPRLQQIVHLIEQDVVKAVMTWAVDRISRDPDMVEAATFARICKEHQCLVIVTRDDELYTFDFNNPRRDDQALFLAEAKSARDYIVHHVKGRMHPARRKKALRGEYDGRNVPIGFTLDGPAKHRYYVIYEPHAVVVRWIFRRYRELGGNFAALKKAVQQKIADQGYLFPFYSAGMNAPYVPLGKNEHGYVISDRGLKDLLTNVAYIGWWLVSKTVDKNTPTHRRELLARRENNHPAIVDAADFWYAFDRISPQSIDGLPREQPTQRSRYSKVGTLPANALLEGIVASDGLPVYVYQRATQPDGAVYTIENPKAYYDKSTHGSLYVRELDKIFTDHLLEKVEEGRKLRQQFAGSGWEHELDGVENAMAVLLTDFTKMQQESTAGIDTQIAEYTAEADSLDRTLHYGASALDGDTITKYAERLARLRRSIAQLVVKKDRAKVAQAELAEFAEKLGNVPDVWGTLGIEKQRRFIQLVTAKITLTKPAPNWLQLEIVWLWTDAPDSVCYIWQRKGHGEAWTEEENTLIRTLYPQRDRATIVAALPTRSWAAIINQAMHLGVSRPYQSNNSTLHKTLSVDDAAFMARVGIHFDAQNPYQRIWWTTAI